MNTIELQNDLINLIRTVDNVRVLEAIKILIEQTKTASTDFWDELPETVQEGIKQGLKESELGDVIPHEMVMKQIREKYNTPVIMLTARGDESDKILGLELGADDYISKPFSSRELVARIKAIIRRSNSSNKNKEIKDINNNEDIDEEVIRIGDFIFDKKNFVISDGKKEIELGMSEFKILEAFFQRPKVILSRDDLMNYARGREFLAFDRSIDMHISRLRQKIKSLACNNITIKTFWGAGYRLIIED